MGVIGPKLQLINGKLFKNGVQVTPTFGDWEQIRLLKALERKANEQKVEAKLIQNEITQYFATVKFICPACNSKNEVDLFEDEPSEWHIDNIDVDNNDISCSNCNMDFTIEAIKDSKSSMAIQLSYDPIDEI